MPTAEGALKAAVLKRLNDLKKHDPSLAFRKRLGTVLGTAGDPDIHGIWAGVPFEIELKAPGKSPTLLQLARLAEWARAGAVTGVARSLADFENLLDQVRRRKPDTPARSVSLD